MRLQTNSCKIIVPFRTSSNHE